MVDGGSYLLRMKTVAYGIQMGCYSPDTAALNRVFPPQFRWSASAGGAQPLSQSTRCLGQYAVVRQTYADGDIACAAVGSIAIPGAIVLVNVTLLMNTPLELLGLAVFTASINADILS